MICPTLEIQFSCKRNPQSDCYDVESREEGAAPKQEILGQGDFLRFSLKNNCLIKLEQGKANVKEALPGTGGHSFHFWKKVTKSTKWKIFKVSINSVDT